MRIPVATYRLQFGPSFGFKDARAVVPYLAQLGVSDIYASPILKATGGSTHGYDVTDPNELNPQLGTKEDFASLAAERETHGIGWLQDIVPNHMAYSSENALLMDVLENGPQSEYADWFDVFRDHPDAEMRSKLVAPFLGSPIEDVLQRGELHLDLDRDGLALRYYDWRFPLRPDSYVEVLTAAAKLNGEDGPSQTLSKLGSDWASLRAMARGPQRREGIAQAKLELATLQAENESVAARLQRVIDDYNDSGRSPDAQAPLRQLIERQWFRPVFWQTAGQKINYRRFFYLNDFISLRVEKTAVFDKVHECMLKLVRDGVVTGLRIDHIDGLRDPLAYLRRLRGLTPDGYLVVEKILELEETLPSIWPIEGTSGYKFCNCVNGLFCDRGSEPAMTDIYHEFIGGEADYATQLYEAKLGILRKHMGGEVAYLTHLIPEAVGEQDDVSTEAWRGALTALMAAFPVYRTYIDAQQFTDQDRAFITEAVLEAKKRAPDYQGPIDRIGELLLSYRPLEVASAEQETRRYVVMRFQQFTGPAMAKGLEDTLFYTYNRFVSLNEVGGDPELFGIPLDRFHRFNEMRARHWPHAMNATSTHDAKRGEDVRARLNVLSEIPDRWREKVTTWARFNGAYKQQCGDVMAPDANDEYLLYQTLVGALPFDEREYDDFKQRLKEYTVKALREAKRHTTWSEPNAAYEKGCLAFVDRILDRDSHNTFWPDFLPFQKEIAGYGVYNSLAQTTLKIMCPGVPDFYQGAELWDLNLVDPDNRRPVDFGTRMWALETFQTVQPGEAGDIAGQLLASEEDGRVKLFLIHTLLAVRAAHRAVFDNGDYLPLEVSGQWARHVVAFLRSDGNDRAIVLVPRFLTTLVACGQSPTGVGVWGDTRISLRNEGPTSWRSVITGDALETTVYLRVGDALARFPIAVLLGQAARA